jgi:HAD superfamily hydrolase (TIGR01450 family)
MGVVCDRQEILTAAQASASFIAQHQIDRGRGLFIIGTEALKQEVIAQGLSIADPDDCGAVLVGLDPNFDYAKINMALRAIAHGASLVICNRDANFPVEGGYRKAGCGAMVGAIESASGRVADFEIGKPNTIMLDIIIDRMRINLNNCLIIGDMLASDILMANNAGLPSVWISETSPSEKLTNFPQPTLSMPSLMAIANCV